MFCLVRCVLVDVCCWWLAVCCALVCRLVLIDGCCLLLFVVFACCLLCSVLACRPSSLFVAVCWGVLWSVVGCPCWLMCVW